MKPARVQTRMSAASINSPSASVGSLFLTFLKIGLFTIGGGYAMLAMVRKSIVQDKGWVKEEDFIELIALLQSIPGIFAVNTALCVGAKACGKKGSLAAAAGAILPSLVIVLMLTIFARVVKGNPVVESCFKGIRPCVVALILSPAIQMIRKSGITARNFMLPVAAAVLICVFGISPVWVILAAAVGGASYGLYIQKKQTS